jgi:hypothetical protein
VIRFRYLPLLAGALSGLPAAELKPETAAAFDRYVKLTEDGFAKNQGFENFLWLDHHPKEKSLVWLSQSVIAPLQTLDQGQAIEVPDGVIQHWLGVVYLEGITLDRVRDVALNFADYKTFFKQEVIDSKLIKHNGEQFDALVRFYKAQISIPGTKRNTTRSAHPKMQPAICGVSICIGGCSSPTMACTWNWRCFPSRAKRAASSIRPAF